MEVDHLGEQFPDVQGVARRRAVGLGAGSVQVGYQAFAVQEVGERGRVRLACDGERGESRGDAVGGQTLDVAQLGLRGVEEFGAADRAVAGTTMRGERARSRSMTEIDPATEPVRQNGVAPDITTSPVNRTRWSGSQTTVSLVVWAVPRCISSARHRRGGG
ncbi:hypothetical protein ACVWXU_003205 [Streptomyces sp. TE33382]